MISNSIDFDFAKRFGEPVMDKFEVGDKVAIVYKHNNAERHYDNTPAAILNNQHDIYEVKRYDGTTDCYHEANLMDYGKYVHLSKTPVSQIQPLGSNNNSPDKMIQEVARSMFESLIHGVEEEENKIICNHEWVKTELMFSTVEDCMHCSVKKEELK